MSVESYQAAAARLREVLDLLGPYRGRCAMCGHPDARHRQADAIAGAVCAEDGPQVAAEEYLRPDVEMLEGVLIAQVVAIAVLGAAPARHRVTCGRAAGIDREVWADVLPAAAEE